nr:hypothetical protein [Nanoarchaeum sp.]
MILPILYLIFFVIIFIILLKVTKILWKAILFTLVLFLLITGLTAYLIYKDANKLVKQDKLFLLANDQRVLAGGIITGEFEEIQYLNNSIINNYSYFYSTNDYNSLLTDKYLLIILKTQSLEELNLTVSTPEATIPSEDLVYLLEIENEEEFFKQAQKLNITNSYYAGQDIGITKLVITKDILDTIIKKDTLKLNEIIKEVQFYPDRPSILIIKQMPLKVILSLMIKETIKGGQNGNI